MTFPPQKQPSQSYKKKQALLHTGTLLGKRKLKNELFFQLFRTFEISFLEDSALSSSPFFLFLLPKRYLHCLLMLSNSLHSYTYIFMHYIILHFSFPLADVSKLCCVLFPSWKKWKKNGMCMNLEWKCSSSQWESFASWYIIQSLSLSTRIKF